MEEKVIECIKQEKRALSVHELETMLGFKNVNDLKELLKVLNEMEDKAILYHTKKDKYMLFNDSNSRVGILQVTTKGIGFVQLEDGSEIKVFPEHLNGAINKDKVIVNIDDDKAEPKVGSIVKIVERQNNQVVGTIVIKNNKIYVKPDDKKLNIKIVIEHNYHNNLVEGHKVVAKLLSLNKNKEYTAQIVKIIGHINDPGVDILCIMAEHFINDAFPEDVLKQAMEMPNKVTEEEINERLSGTGRDLRDEVIFTIDGDDTKDIDDAISIEKLENNHYKLGVHIADVSYYVKEGSPLDLEAQDRGTSVYLADRVTPMLPHELSNGICSLNPNVDRFAISCVMEIDEKGETLSYEIFDSIIRSRIQMTYKKVNQILEENIVPEGYEDYANKLRLMSELANILRKNKEEKGYIDFEIDEPKIIVDENGEAIDVVLRNRGTGEKIIEDFMIAANEAVATQFYYTEYPLVYRVHGEPSEEKMTNFMRLVSVLGYHVTANMNKLTPKTIQSILNQLKDKKEYYILSSQMLRSMQKAVYDTHNIGHFGLASKIYCHFTSPIRRYPDLSVHRSIRKCLLSGSESLENIKKWESKLPLIAEHSSIKERAAIDCERDVDDMKMAEYMEKHIGEEYHGIITGVMSFGFFVQLPNMIEGLVHVEELKGDFYTYDESTFSLTSAKNKRGYRLGDEVDVIVKSASKEEHTVDFSLKELEECQKEKRESVN